MLANITKALLVLAILILPVKTHAIGALYYQTSGTTYTTNGGIFYQTLGNGLFGRIDQFTIYDQVTSTATTSIQMAFYECSSAVTNSVIGCAEKIAPFYLVPSAIRSAGTYTEFYNASSTIPLDSTKYYVLMLQGGTNMIYKGSSSNSYTNGDATNTGDFGNAFAGNLGTVVDLNFVLSGEDTGQGSTTTSRVDFTFPTMGMVATSSTVHFIGTYDNEANFTQLWITVQDLTVGHTYTDAFSITSGTGGFNRTHFLTANHAYRIGCNFNRSDNPVIGGGCSTVIFSTISTTSPVINSYINATSTSYDENGNLILPTGATTTLTDFASATAYLKTGFGEIGAAICSRLIVSYICDLGNVIQELDQINNVPVAKFTIPLGGIYTNPANNATSTEITFFDPTSLQSGGLHQQIRTLAGYGLWLSWGVSVFFLILKIF